MIASTAVPSLAGCGASVPAAGAGQTTFGRRERERDGGRGVGPALRSIEPSDQACVRSNETLVLQFANNERVNPHVESARN
ncbi:MAG TPA: hypothetical protein VF170_09595, partial [Planctomycetaceae bacterium]